MRWNAMAMVVQANKKKEGIGGHISTYASAATLYEVGFNHFFRGGDGIHPADIIYFPGTCRPGIYARSFLRRGLFGNNLENFRRELNRRAVVLLSPSTSDAGLLAVSHCFNGTGPTDCHLPGTIQQISCRTRDLLRRSRSENLGFFR